MATTVKEAFDNILRHIEEEDYDRCTSSASHFVRTYTGPDAQRYQPYAEFFKLFADAYHTWQLSYHYTPIRSSFLMASNRLQQLPDEIRRAKDHAVVVEGLKTLCKMLLSYTWCENSIINNDPFALKDHSQAAIDLENAGLAHLVGFSSEEPHLKRIVAWLRKYFEKNLYLHTGLNACALIYASIMRDRTCPETLFRVQMLRAEKALDKLTPLSSELSSELNAHIRHVRQHYERLVTPPESPTFLRVRSGKLVLSLSAACDRTGTQRLLGVDRLESQHVLSSFEDAVRSELGRLGFVVDADSFRPTQLMDIFETTFGEYFLKSLTFDIGPSPVKLTFLDERTSDLDIHVTLSALGVCTVAFEMAIDGDPYGFSVEDIRVLESCICPHAGQVRLEIERAGKPIASPARFFDRVDITKLNETIEIIGERANDDSDSVLGEKVDAVRKELKDYFDHALTDAHGMTASDRQMRDQKLCNAVNSVIPCVTDTAHVKALLACCHRHTRLAEFAEELLGAIERAFRSAIGPSRRKRGKHESLSEDEVWHLRPDLGWYAYLYATRIDEVTTALEPVRQAVAFSDIQGHPDAVGLVIDQREARASFDDWRFMTLQVSPEDNLAHVRSHASDAFYTSEFQTFFYFPDDPQYLVDQYEATVELILRLNVGLRFYNAMAETLTHQIRRDEDRGPAAASKKSRRMRDLTRDLERARRLRIEANELRNLVLKAGISRYQDHGRLMKRILDQMNVESVAVLADRHLSQLEDLSREIIERLKASRVKWLSYAGIAVTSLVSASVTKDFFEAWLRGDHEGRVTSIFMLIVFVASLTIFSLLGRPPSEK